MEIRFCPEQPKNRSTKRLASQKLLTHKTRMTQATIVPLPSPPAPQSSVSADAVVAGPPIPAIDRIKLFSDAQWEDFVLEWADSLRDQYVRVDRCGGAGDMGRDVVATVKNGSDEWDNYQCKHYKESLKPTDIWIELGKLAFYSKRGDYTYPRRYFFIAPQGAGTKLSNLLKKPEALRAGLIANWETYCRDTITSAQTIGLDATLKAHIEGLDFSIYDATPPLRIIDGHAKTRWHVARFGGGLPPRPAPVALPSDPADTETAFVRELFQAYSDHLKQPVRTITDLAKVNDLHEHFGDSRLEFYSAESLRTFSRDTLPPGEFEKLQEEVHSGIRDEIRGDHADGYKRVVAVVKMARSLPLRGHALHGRMAVRDHGGICHQLANDGKVRWVK